ncbi:MAG: hypothetical protein JWL77_3978 [Chthonomonadaceae bacterium]|nr:hypothetical protein [Chthonomonadaceae bacterium]
MILTYHLLGLACYTLGTVYYGYHLLLIVRKQRNKSEEWIVKGVESGDVTLDNGEKNGESRHPDSNRRPAVYETAALPLSYVGSLECAEAGLLWQNTVGSVKVRQTVFHR